MDDNFLFFISKRFAILQNVPVKQQIFKSNARLFFAIDLRENFESLSREK